MFLMVCRQYKMAADCHPPLRLFRVAEFGRKPLKCRARRGLAATLERPGATRQFARQGLTCGRDWIGCWKDLKL
jgi:hypothetical protein